MQSSTGASCTRSVSTSLLFSSPYADVLRFVDMSTQRLALRRHDTSDEAALVRPLLALMQEHRLDFHGAFRTLCAFRPRGTDEERDALIARILEHASEPERLDRAAAEEAWRTWLAKYAVRIESERDEWVPDAEGKEKTEIDAEVDVAREAAARAANPRFVLRQWMLEEVIKKVEGDPESGRRILGKVLKVSRLLRMGCE